MIKKNGNIAMSDSSVGVSRNLLICGSGGVGKSSLGVTLARGVFPPPDCVPRLFEGWTITAR